MVELGDAAKALAKLEPLVGALLLTAVGCSSSSDFLVLPNGVSVANILVVVGAALFGRPNPKLVKGLAAGCGDPATNGFVMDGFTVKSEEVGSVVNEEAPPLGLLPNGFSVDDFILSRKELPLEATDPNLENGAATDSFGSVDANGLLPEAWNRSKNSLFFDESEPPGACLAANGLLDDGLTGLTNESDAAFGFNAIDRDDLPGVAFCGESGTVSLPFFVGELTKAFIDELDFACCGDAEGVIASFLEKGFEADGATTKEAFLEERPDCALAVGAKGLEVDNGTLVKNDVFVNDGAIPCCCAFLWSAPFPGPEDFVTGDFFTNEDTTSLLPF